MIVRWGDFTKELKVLQEFLSSAGCGSRNGFKKLLSLEKRIDADYVFILRLLNLEQTYAHINKNFFQRTRGARRLRHNNSAQIKMKVINDVMMQRC